MKIFSTYLLVFVVALMASCKKDNNTGTNTGAPPAATGTKYSPDGFNYATTRAINVNLTLLAPNGDAITGVVVRFFNPGDTVNTVFKAASDKSGKVTATINVPTAQTGLLIDPVYSGLMHFALASINGNTITATLGGSKGYSGDIVPQAVVPMAAPAGAKATSSVGLHTNGYRLDGATGLDFGYQSPYTNALNAITAPVANGVPVYLDPTNDVITASQLSYINASVQEGVKLSTTHPQYLASSAVNVINVAATTDIYVTFLSEGANYLNSLGWYSYPTNSPPTAVTGGTNSGGINKISLVFPNASANGSGGGLVSGNRVKIGTFNAGTTIAFCLLQNAWQTFSGDSNNPYGSNVNALKFFSQDALNPESIAANKRHQVLMYDNVNNNFVYGFEDVQNESGYPYNDMDFNDLVVSVKSSVNGAISNANVAAIDKGGDTDGDGVPDAQDAFPNDPLKAYILNLNYTYAFEDNFPAKGDYDLNDLVVNVNYIFISNAQNAYVSVEMLVNPLAVGASFKNGFGMEIPGVSPSNVKSVTGQQIKGNYITFAGNGVEAGQTYATVIPFDNTDAVINNPDGAFFINTLASKPKVTGTAADVLVTFNNPVVFTANFNPFLISNQRRGYEVHLPGYTMTSKGNTALFGTGDDVSNIAGHASFTSNQNLPWAMYFSGSSTYTWPYETINITQAYPHFVDWAASGGGSYQDWLTNTSAGYRDLTKIFTKP